MTTFDPSDIRVSPSFPYRDALVLAISLAHRAGAMLLEIHRQGPNRVERKSSQVDLVTEADVASQELILEAIGQRFPDHGILAEEEQGGRRQGNGNALWLVDPLDGTTNFASRFPVFGVSIALWVDGEPQVGVVQDVVRERTYWAGRGQGAWMDLERRVHVSNTAELDQSLLATGFPYSRATNPDNNLAEFNALIPQSAGHPPGGLLRHRSGLAGRWTARRLLGSPALPLGLGRRGIADRRGRRHCHRLRRPAVAIEQSHNGGGQSSASPHSTRGHTVGAATSRLADR